MAILAEQKATIINDYKRNESDTSSPEVQVAILTARIKDLTEHLKQHKQDFSSRRGLLMLAARRSRLLRYLAKTDRERYQTLIQRLGLRK